MLSPTPSPEPGLWPRVSAGGILITITGLILVIIVLSSSFVIMLVKIKIRMIIIIMIIVMSIWRSSQSAHGIRLTMERAILLRMFDKTRLA